MENEIDYQFSTLELVEINGGKHSNYMDLIERAIASRNFHPDAIKFFFKKQPYIDSRGHKKDRQMYKITQKGMLLILQGLASYRVGETGNVEEIEGEINSDVPMYFYVVSDSKSRRMKFGISRNLQQRMGFHSEYYDRVLFLSCTQRARDIETFLKKYTYDEHTTRGMFYSAWSKVPSPLLEEIGVSSTIESEFCSAPIGFVIENGADPYLTLLKQKKESSPPQSRSAKCKESQTNFESDKITSAGSLVMAKTS